MYTLNFSIGPNIPNRFAFINELMSSKSTCISFETMEREKKPSDNKMKIVSAVALSLIALSAATWAYYNTSPTTQSSEKEPISTPSKPTNPITEDKLKPETKNISLITDSSENSPSSLWVCKPFENKKRTCFDLFSLPTGDISPALSLFSLSHIISSNSVQFPSLPSDTINKISQQVSDYVLQFFSDKSRTSSLPALSIDFCPTNTTSPNLEHFNSFLKKTEGTPSYSLGLTVFRDLEQKGVFLEKRNSQMWACKQSSNGEKICLDIFNVLQKNIRQYPLLDFLLPTGTKTHRGLNAYNKTANQQQDLISRPQLLPLDNPTLTDKSLHTEKSNANSPISVDQFIEDLQKSARHSVIKQTIQQIKNPDAISQQFRDLTINIIKQVIRDIKSGKKGTAISYQPKHILNGLQIQKGWVMNTPAAIDIVRDWITEQLRISREKARQENNAIPYLDFTLTEDDNPILLKAIYGRMRMTLETAYSQLSTDQQAELTPYITACQIAEAGGSRL